MANRETWAKRERRWAWMREYERLVLESRPALAGKVCWCTATYFYNEGLTAANAAAKFVQHTEREVNIGDWNRSQVSRCEKPIATRGPAQCEDGHWLGSNEHPISS